MDALYHYEKLELLKPDTIDNATGYRYYDASQLLIVYKILALKDAGFSLLEIAYMLHQKISTAALIEMLEHKAQALETAMNHTYSRLERLHTNLFLIKNGGIPYMNDITIKKVAPILIASTRKMFPKKDFDANLEQMWPAVNHYIEEKGIKRTVPCLMLYHSGWWDMAQWNMMYDAQNLDVEVAEPVTRPFDGNEEIRVYTLPAAEKMACIVHNGPFATIAQTSDALFQWMQQNHYDADGPMREIYHKGDWATDCPEEYVTELQIPIR